jgi:hypothetical protein
MNAGRLPERIVLIAIVSLAACEEQLPVDVASARVVRPDWERNHWNVTWHFERAGGLRPVAFRAGPRAMVSLLSGPPTHHFQFITRCTKCVGYGVVKPFDRPMPFPSPGHVSDVIGHTAAGVPWVLDSANGWVSQTDIGSGVLRVAELGARFRTRRACMADTTSIWFLDDRRGGTVYRRATAAPKVLDSIRIPAAVHADFAAAWDSVRFAGAYGEPCLLFGTQLGSLISLDTIGPQVISALRSTPPPLSRWHRLRRALQRTEVRAPIRDVTRFPGGIAVLRGGTLLTDGNTVDLYDRSGAYTRTIRLSRGMARRIAGSDRGLFAIRTHKDTVLLAQYPLPRELVQLRVPVDTGFTAPPPPPDVTIVDTTRRRPIELPRPRGVPIPRDSAWR